MLRRLTDRWWFKWLVFGTILRLILMPITLHPDIWGHSFTAYFFAYQGKLDPYQALISLPNDNPIVRNFGITDIFIYPPLTYFTLGIFRLLIKPFVDPNFLPFVMEFPSQVYERADLLWNLFLFKLPYLFIDIGLGFLLAGIFDDLDKKKKAFMFWMINPVTIYATFMLGQIDILPTFFTVLSLYFAGKDKKSLSLLSLGIGASYKLWPVFLVIPAALILETKFWKRLKYMALGLLPLAVTLLPYFNSKAFRYMVFSPKSQKMLYMNFPVTAAEGIYPFILILTIIYFYVYFKNKEVNLSACYLAVLLTIFSVTHYHPQWFLWLTPFVVIELVSNNLKYWVIALMLFLSWLMITLFFEPSLSIGLFAPIYKDVLNFSGLTDVVSKYYNVFQIKSIIRSIFAGGAAFYIFDILRPNSKGIR
jgi:hypothetical protein